MLHGYDSAENITGSQVLVDSAEKVTTFDR
jgi:hypothetical protein